MKLQLYEHFHAIFCGLALVWCCCVHPLHMPYNMALIQYSVYQGNQLQVKESQSFNILPTQGQDYYP